MSPKAIGGWALGALVAADLLILLAGQWVLVGEARGEEYTPYSRFSGVEKIGDTLSCSYFTGRSVQVVRYGGYESRPAECPFLLNSRG